MSKYESFSDNGIYIAKLYSNENGKWLYSGISFNFHSKRELKKFLRKENKNV